MNSCCFSFVWISLTVLLSAVCQPLQLGSCEEQDRANRESKAGPSTAPTRRLKVTVTDKKSKPLPNANVQIAGWAANDVFGGNKVHSCNERGEVEFDVPAAPDLLRIWARESQHAGMFAQWWPEMEPRPRPIPRYYEFRLDPGSTIGGVVKNEEGKPIEGVRVDVEYSNPAHAGEITTLTLDSHLSEKDRPLFTDAKGEWRLHNAPARGELVVSLWHPDFVSDYQYGSIQKAQKVDTPAFRKQTAELVMHRGARVSGFVHDPDDKPIKDAVVVWGNDPWFTPGTQEARTDAKGRFTFPPLPAGTQNFAAVAVGFAPDYVQSTIGSEDTVINFVMSAGRTIRIRCVDAAGVPIPEAWVTISRWRDTKLLYTLKHREHLDMQIPNQTDVKGIYEWTWAPQDEVIYAFGKKGLKTNYVRITASDKEREVVLYPETP